jgi:hypothetical protein
MSCARNDEFCRRVEVVRGLQNLCSHEPRCWNRSVILKFYFHQSAINKLYYWPFARTLRALGVTGWWKISVSELGAKYHDGPGWRQHCWKPSSRTVGFAPNNRQARCRITPVRSGIPAIFTTFRHSAAMFQCGIKFGSLGAESVLAEECR